MLILGLILDFLEAIPYVGKLFTYFRGSPLKDMEKAHDVENKVDSLSDTAVIDELQSKWRR